MITDWDDAYANRAHVPYAQPLIDAWPGEAQAFRDAHGNSELGIAYADDPRCKYDLFLPDGQSKGLFVFVHGGYWLLFDRSYWSHYATGALAHGYAVAVIEYPVAPAATFPQISAATGAAIAHAAGRVDGPVVLAGHSAGGHLVARVATRDGSLPPPVQERVTRVTPISGLFDLRPMLQLEMNDDWGLDLTTVMAESPAFQMPLPGVTYTAWVGSAERPEFLRQNALLANIWTGCGARISAVEDPDRHHFDVIDGLKDANSPLMRAVLG